MTMRSNSLSLSAVGKLLLLAASVAKTWRLLWQAYGAHQRRHAAIMRLEALSDHTLADIGLRRDVIEFALSERATDSVRRYVL